MEKKIRFLSLNEIDLVLRNSPEYLRPIIVIAIHTGLRKSELFRLRWDDVDFNRGYVIASSMDNEHTKNYRNREIPMTEQLRECLNNIKAKSEWVLCKQNGERYSGCLRKGLEKIARDAGIKKFTLHDLRHTFASHLVMEGIDLPTVQNLMGHSEIKTTMIYSHLAPDHLKNAMKRFSARLGYDTNMAH
jgi:integrase